MKKRGKLVKNTIVTTVMSNFGLYKALDEIGVAYEKTAVGDRFVYEKMSEMGYILGGEQSGHIIFSKYATTGDGVLTSLKIMQAVIDEKLPVSKLAQPMKAYPQILKNIRVVDGEKVLKNEKVRAVIARVEKELGNSGRILVRKSGTEPLVRVMVEAETLANCEKLVGEVVTVIEENI